MNEPKHSEMAEMNFLGSILMDNKAFYKVQFIKPEMFYFGKNQIIFKAILSMLADYKPIAIDTLAIELQHSKQLQAIGGTIYLSDILTGTPTAANIEFHAEEIKANWLSRQINQFGIELQQTDKNPYEVLNQINEKLNDLNRNETNNHITPKELALETLSYIENKMSGKIKTIPFSIEGLNNELDGYIPGDYTVFIARSGTGKSALKKSEAYHLSKLGYKVAIFLLETLPRKELIRLAAQDTLINSRWINQGKLNQKEFGKLIAYLNEFADKSNIFIENMPLAKGSDIINRANYLINKYGIDIIFIDYIQLIQPDKKVRSQEEQISEASKICLTLAKKHGIPITAIAQLNRESKDRKNLIPLITDIRGSDAIQHDADNIIAVYNPYELGLETYGQDFDKQTTYVYYPDIDRKMLKCQLQIQKSRDGNKSIVWTNFYPEYTMFSDKKIYEIKEEEPF